MLFRVGKSHNNHIKFAHFVRPTLVPRAAYVRRYALKENQCSNQ